MKKILNYLGPLGVFNLIVITIVIIFCVQNLAPIQVKFLFWEIASISKIYLVLISIFIGFLFGVLFGHKFFSSKKPNQDL